MKHRKPSGRETASRTLWRYQHPASDATTPSRFLLTSCQVDSLTSDDRSGTPDPYRWYVRHYWQNR